jgi:hypothetical protein
MPEYKVDDAFEMDPKSLTKAMLGEIPTSPEYKKLRVIQKTQWSIKNQENTEEVTRLTKELVAQTTLMANRTGSLVLATWGVVLITLITQLAFLLVSANGVVQIFCNLMRAISAY